MPNLNAATHNPDYMYSNTNPETTVVLLLCCLPKLCWIISS